MSNLLTLFTDALDLPHQKNVGPGSNQRHGRDGDQRPREVVPLDQETNGQWDYDGGQIANEVEDAAGQADQALRGEALTIFGDGSQTRSFCYVADLVDGLVRLSQSEERFPVNLGNPVELTILEFAERIKRLMGVSVEIAFEPLPSDDPKRRQPNITKARTVLGWEPKVVLEDGLRETVGYFKGVAG